MKFSSLLFSLSFLGIVAHVAAISSPLEAPKLRNVTLGNTVPTEDVKGDLLVSFKKRCEECDEVSVGYDYSADGCPRRYHRNRFGRCVRNGGGGGCRWGFRRDRRGFCVSDSDDSDDDDWRGGPGSGNCPSDFSPDGSGTDGFSFDIQGNGPSASIPAGWAYFGEEIGWAPYAGWVPSPSWRPPTVFINVWVQVTWWTPPSAFLSYWSDRCEWSQDQIPSFWGWTPRRIIDQRKRRHRTRFRRTQGHL